MDEKSDEVYSLMVGHLRGMTFLPRRSDAPDVQDHDSLLALEDPSVFALERPEDEPEGEGSASRHTDTRLQTAMDDDRLQKRLLQLHYDARSALEEQGFNILYLAIGFLQWVDPASPDKCREAPLILLPVELSRTSARARFQLRFTEEELSTNHSLKESSGLQFGVELP